MTIVHSAICRPGRLHRIAMSAAARAPSARKPATATSRKPAAAAPVIRETPVTTIRRNMVSFIIESYYSALEDALPGVGANGTVDASATSWFLKENVDYQSWSNIHADDINALTETKKRIMIGVMPLTLIQYIAREFIAEARRCENAMLKYPDDPIAFVAEGIPEDCSVVATVLNSAEMIKQIEGEKLNKTYEDKEWISNYIKGEIMRTLLPRVSRHAGELGYRFVAFLKHFAYVAASIGLFEAMLNIDLQLTAGIFKIMGFDGSWLNALASNAVEADAEAKAESAAKRAAGAAGGSAVDDGRGVEVQPSEDDAGDGADAGADTGDAADAAADE